MMNDFFPLIDEMDREILMHKEVHFSGSFPLMIDYYRKGGKGTLDSIELERIELLVQLEIEQGLSLAQELLSEEEQTKIKEAKQKYLSLKELYEKRDLHHELDQSLFLPLKLADLILSEDLEATQEIEALIQLPKSIPFLIELIQKEEFYDPLFPGYGFAPLHAMECLGLLQTQEAIIPLFESLSKTTFFGEEAAIQALFRIGDPAKNFLLNTLRKTPLSKDNENAAIALFPFQHHPDVMEACLDLLFHPESQSNPLFFNYLLLLCEGIQDPTQQKKLLSLLDFPHLSSENREELRWLLRHFCLNKQKDNLN